MAKLFFDTLAKLTFLSILSIFSSRLRGDYPTGLPVDLALIYICVYIVYRRIDRIIHVLFTIFDHVNQFIAIELHFILRYSLLQNGVNDGKHRHMSKKYVLTRDLLIIIINREKNIIEA